MNLSQEEIDLIRISYIANDSIILKKIIPDIMFGIFLKYDWKDFLNKQVGTPGNKGILGKEDPYDPHLYEIIDSRVEIQSWFYCFGHDDDKKLMHQILFTLRSLTTKGFFTFSTFEKDQLWTPTKKVYDLCEAANVSQTVESLWNYFYFWDISYFDSLFDQKLPEQLLTHPGSKVRGYARYKIMLKEGKV